MIFMLGENSVWVFLIFLLCLLEAAAFLHIRNGQIYDE